MNSPRHERTSEHTSERRRRAAAIILSAAGCTGLTVSCAAGAGLYPGATRNVDAGTGSAGDASATDASAPPEPAATGYYVRGRNLYDRCGERVVLRGVNHPTLYVDRPGDALPEIAKTGANVVRIFWYAENGVPISAAKPVIARAIANGMIPMLEMHDSTCQWKLDPIVRYYTAPDALALIHEYEANLLINIANEPSPPSDTEFANEYSSVVREMRGAGIHTPLVIDGGNCGRDYGVLFSQGPAVLAADPDHNLIFSAHLYDPLSDAQLVSVFQQSIALDLPFIVGEFANREPPGCGPALNYDALVQEASRFGIGWLAWSWGDNDPATYWNTDCSEFDMTRTFSASTLMGWGKDVAMDSAASIKNTAVRPRSLVTGSCN